MQPALPSFTRLPKKVATTARVLSSAEAAAAAASPSSTPVGAAAPAPGPSFSSSDAALPPTDLPRPGRNSQEARTSNGAPQDKHMSSSMALASPPPAGSALAGHESAQLSRSSAANGSSQGPQNATSVSVPGDGGDNIITTAAETADDRVDEWEVSKQSALPSNADEESLDEGSHNDGLAELATNSANSEVQNANASSAASAKRRGRPPGSSKAKRQQQMANAKAARKLELDTRREQRLLLSQSQSPIASTSGTNALATSAAMSRTDSATSRASTRSMRSRETRGSKRKFNDEDVSEQDSSLENDQRALVDGSAPSSSARNAPQRRSHRPSRYSEAGSTEPESRQVSPTPTADEAALSTTPRQSKSKLRLFLKPSTLRHEQHDTTTSASSSRAASAASAKAPLSSAKRTKRRIEESDEEETASPTTSRAPSTSAGQDLKEENQDMGAIQAASANDEDVDMDLDQSERGTSIASSVSVPLASARRTSDATFLRGEAALNALSAKLEPMSDDDNDTATMGGRSRATSAGAESAKFSNAGSIEDEVGDAPVSATSSLESAAAKSNLLDPKGKSTGKGASAKGSSSRLRLPVNAHFAASDAEDDMSSVAGTSTGFPTPSEEKDIRLGTSATQGKGAQATKKRRGRPPKAKLGLDGTPPTTPGPSTPKDRSETANIDGSAKMDTTVKDRLFTTLERERQLIADGTHPLFLEALADYDTIRQEKIQTQQTILDTKENVATKLLQATEDSLWEVWLDQKRDLWYQMMMEVRRNARRLTFENNVEEAVAADASGLLGELASRWWGKEGRSAPFTFPPTIEPLIKVATAPVAAPKGRTRSSNKPLIEAGQAYMMPLNLKNAQGLSTLADEEVRLDLEIMGLSSRKLEENWFHAQPIFDDEILQEADSPEAELEQEVFPAPPEAHHVPGLVHSGVPASGRARDPYGLPVYADAYYDPSRYAHAPRGTFNFPSSARSRSPGRHQATGFAFPSAPRFGPSASETFEGRSRADAILIDDEATPLKVEYTFDRNIPPPDDSGFVEQSSLSRPSDRTVHKGLDYQQRTIERMNDRARYLPSDPRDVQYERDARDKASHAATLKRGRPKATPSAAYDPYSEQRYESTAPRTTASDPRYQKRMHGDPYQQPGRAVSPMYAHPRRSPPTSQPGHRERTLSRGQEYRYEDEGVRQWPSAPTPSERGDPRYAAPPSKHQRHQRVPSHTSREHAYSYDEYGRPLYPPSLYRDAPPPGHPEMYPYPGPSYYSGPPPPGRYAEDPRQHPVPGSRQSDPYRGAPLPPEYYYASGPPDHHYLSRSNEQYALAPGQPQRTKPHEVSGASQKLPQSRYYGYAAPPEAHHARASVRPL